jgi:hypothetical protein
MRWQSRQAARWGKEIRNERRLPAAGAIKTGDLALP